MNAGPGLTAKLREIDERIEQLVVSFFKKKCFAGRLRFLAILTMRTYRVVVGLGREIKGTRSVACFVALMTEKPFWQKFKQLVKIYELEF